MQTSALWPMAGSRLSHPESPLSLPTTHSFLPSLSVSAFRPPPWNLLGQVPSMWGALCLLQPDGPRLLPLEPWQVQRTRQCDHPGRPPSPAVAQKLPDPPRARCPLDGCTEPCCPQRCGPLGTQLLPQHTGWHRAEERETARVPPPPAPAVYSHSFVSSFSHVVRRCVGLPDPVGNPDSNPHPLS